MTKINQIKTLSLNPRLLAQTFLVMNIFSLTQVLKINQKVLCLLSHLMILIKCKILSLEEPLKKNYCGREKKMRIFFRLINNLMGTGLTWQKWQGQIKKLRIVARGLIKYIKNKIIPRLLLRQGDLYPQVLTKRYFTCMASLDQNGSSSKRK